MFAALLVALGLLAGGQATPQKGPDDRVGLERPSTIEPPKIDEGTLDSTLCEVFNNCEDNQPQPSTPQQPYVPPGGTNPNPYPGGGDYQPEPSTPQQPYPNNNQPSGDGDGCTCVQYYLCTDNNTINDNGVGLIDIRIKDEVCKDYLEKCCGRDNIISEPITPRPTQPPIGRQSSCGNRNPEGLGFRITGDNDNESQYGEFPWMVAVMQPSSDASGNTYNVYRCGGSLIHPQVVLTGAHCIYGFNNLMIRAGEWDTQTKNEFFPTQDRQVRDIIIHEQFNNNTLSNDPALLILDQPVDMSEANIGLICLPEANENMDGRNCVASGWGKNLYGKEGKYQVILKRVEMPMVPKQQCVERLRRTRLGSRFKLHDSFICAGGIRGKDTCKGDGGSPLVCPSRNNPNVYVQAGIVAWGIDCGTETPGVYVNVPLFVNWIINKLAASGITIDNF